MLPVCFHIAAAAAGLGCDGAKEALPAARAAQLCRAPWAVGSQIPVLWGPKSLFSGVLNPCSMGSQVPVSVGSQIPVLWNPKSLFCAIPNPCSVGSEIPVLWDSKSLFYGIPNHCSVRFQILVLWGPKSCSVGSQMCWMRRHRSPSIPQFVFPVAPGLVFIHSFHAAS